MSDRPLTERQRRFIDAYIETGNATKSAIMAGYSLHTAKQQGSLQLTKVDVAAELAARQSVLAQRHAITIDDIVARLDEAGRTAPRMGDRIRANQLLGDHLGMFPRGEVNVNIDARQQVLASLAGMTDEQLLRLAGGDDGDGPG